MTSNNEQHHFFDADIIYEINRADILQLSSLFSYLAFVRPRHNSGENSRLTYEYWAGYFSALSDNLDDNNDIKNKLKFYNDDYKFFCSLVTYIDNKDEKQNFERILQDLKKV